MQWFQRLDSEFYLCPLYLRPMRKDRTSALLRAMTGKVGLTDSERIRWLIGFANLGIAPGTLSHREISEIQEQLDQFVFGAIGRGFASIGTAGEPMSEQSIVGLRDDVQYGLRLVARLSDLQQGFVGWQIGKKITELEWFVRKGAIGIRGPRDAMVLFCAAALIASDEGKRICECAADDCPCVFYQWRRGRYCSPQCSQRTRTKRLNPKRGKVKTRG